MDRIRKFKKSLGLFLAIIMTCTLCSTAFANEMDTNVDTEETLTFEEFSEAIEEAFALRGENVKVTGHDENLVLTQQNLDRLLHDITTNPKITMMNDFSESETILESERMVNGLSERTFTVVRSAVTDGIPGYCEVKITFVALVFPNTGEYYDVSSITSRKHFGMFADDWTQTSYTATPVSDYKSVDVEVDGYVDWRYGDMTLTSEHTLTHNFVITK